MTENRLDRRRARTRAALLGAARELLVRRAPAEVSIQEITDVADVGFGSFYNHFASKQALFDQAIAELAAEHGQVLRTATEGLSDPAEVLSVAVRVTARLPVDRPTFARVIDRAGLGYLDAFSPAALGFLRQAHAVGRLCFDDVHVAWACAGGAALGVLRHNLALAGSGQFQELELSGMDQAGTQAALGLLRMFGLAEGDARRITGRSLPVPFG
ncbi:TetR/AcrR family transcriptional regulator [Actinoplanes sp. DH11]|uniref:TetR/AcrR family transcriptional regulator n=1 Tax=Actinoplanes sp. DH11 TaxID=2857011 RepID=UPI001E3979A4|nr:TetR/AcrR family transcriptional regulator [Actinoplanes sp. DH11]